MQISEFKVDFQETALKHLTPSCSNRMLPTSNIDRKTCVIIWRHRKQRLLDQLHFRNFRWHPAQNRHLTRVFSRFFFTGGFTELHMRIF